MPRKKKNPKSYICDICGKLIMEHLLYIKDMEKFIYRCMKCKNFVKHQKNINDFVVDNLEEI